MVESIQEESIRTKFDNLTLMQKAIVGVVLLLFALWVIFVFVILINPNKNVNFRFNIVSILLNGLLWGSMYLALAVGLTLTYKLLGFPNFAHAEFMVIGGFTGIALQRSGLLGDGFGLYFGAIIIAFVFTGIIAIVSDLIVFKPLRQRDASYQTLMITSLGLSLVLRGIVLLIFGNDNQSFSPKIASGFVNLPNFRVDITHDLVIPHPVFGSFPIFSNNFLATVLIILMVFGIYYFLQTTRQGKAMRAVSDNADLAAASGINVERINQISWFIGGGSAGVAGIFYAQLFIFRAETGVIFLLPAFAVIVLGTVGSIVGVFIAAFVLGYIRIISLPILSGLGTAFNRTAYTSLIDVTPFIVLIIVLLFYDKGIGQVIEDARIEQLKAEIQGDEHE